VTSRREPETAFTRVLISYEVDCDGCSTAYHKIKGVPPEALADVYEAHAFAVRDEQISGYHNVVSMVPELPADVWDAMTPLDREWWAREGYYSPGLRCA